MLARESQPTPDRYPSGTSGAVTASTEYSATHGFSVALSCQKLYLERLVLSVPAYRTYSLLHNPVPVDKFKLSL
jgi:hypothetical protein